MSSLAAVQADGYYLDPTKFDPSRGRGSANAIAGSHALGARAKNINKGELVVRFEMPLDTVCLGCGHFCSHGVRFNATKRATGAAYLSTPILSFTMRCPAACGTEWVVHTDPQHADYLFVAGLRRKVKDFVPDEDHDGLGRAGGSLLAGAAVAAAREGRAGDGVLRLQQAVDDSVRAGRAAAELEALLAAGARRREPGVARAAWDALGAARAAAALAAAEGSARGLRVPMAAAGGGGGGGGGSGGGSGSAAQRLALLADERVVQLALGEREEALAAAQRAGGAGGAVGAAGAAAAASAGVAAAPAPIVPPALRAALLAAPLALQQQRPRAPPRAPSEAASALALLPPQQLLQLSRRAPAPAPAAPAALASTAGFSPALLSLIAAGRKRRREDEARDREAAEGAPARIAAALRAASGRAPQVTLGVGPRLQGRVGGLPAAALGRQ